MCCPFRGFVYTSRSNGQNNPSREYIHGFITMHSSSNHWTQAPSGAIRLSNGRIAISVHSAGRSVAVGRVVWSHLINSITWPNDKGCHKNPSDGHNVSGLLITKFPSLIIFSFPILRLIWRHYMIWNLNETMFGSALVLDRVKSTRGELSEGQKALKHPTWFLSRNLTIIYRD